MLLLMTVIFVFSNQEAKESTIVSTSVGRFVVKLESDLIGEQLDEAELEQRAVRIDGYIRKTAHMLEYALLSLTIAFPLFVYRVEVIRIYLLMIAAGVAYAASDEFHQTFVRGRSGNGKDVLIDSAGIVTGVILLCLFRGFTKTLQKKKQNLT